MGQTRIVRNIALGVENLLLHKLRSFLTMLGVVFGVGSVVAMLSVGEGASQEALAQIRRLGSNNIIISSVKSAQEEQASMQHSNMSIYGLTYADQQRVAESVNAIRETAPVKLMRKETRLGERALELRVVGTTPQWFDLVPREVLAGRIIRQADLDHQAPVAVLTEFGARKILATERVVGQSVRIGGDRFEVMGIVKSESGQAGNIQIPDQEVDVYIPIEVARRYFGDIFTKRTSGSEEREKVELHQIIVRVDDPQQVESTAAGIERMLERFHRKKDYAVSVPLALLKQIIIQLLIETVVLSTFGGAIGLGIGTLIPFLITYFSGMPTVVTWEGILLPLIISMAIGILFGLYPAMNAAKVDPIVALRHE